MYRTASPMRPALFVTAILASFPVVATAAQAPLVTVHELKTHWQRYNDKAIRIRGELDACNGGIYGLECSVCPEGTTASEAYQYKCLAFVFDAEAVSPEPPAHFATISLQQQMYRFATVTLEARFTDVCLVDEDGNDIIQTRTAAKPSRQAGPGFVPEEVLICADGSSNLDHVRILAVHSRKSARDAIVSPAMSALLVTASGPERDDMTAEFAKFYLDDGRQTRELFLVPPSQFTRDIGPYAPDGVACVCLQDSCEQQWPTRWFIDMKSPANPFLCWHMHKTNGQWHVTGY
jgi:hypothetical protein